MEKIITIPRELAKEGELILIPRKKYEELLRLKERREFQPTPAQKRALFKARENRKSGKFLTLNELKQKLGFTN